MRALEFINSFLEEFITLGEVLLNRTLVRLGLIYKVADLFDLIELRLSHGVLGKSGTHYFLEHVRCNSRSLVLEIRSRFCLQAPTTAAPAACDDSLSEL